jgi:hypothetical protein
VWACSLNPQPLPPGDADEDASADGTSFSADGSADGGDAFANEPDADAGDDGAFDASMDAADALEAE